MKTTEPSFSVVRSGMAESRPVNRALPLKLWLALEDDVTRHKEEIAQGFAEARKRLLPEPAADAWVDKLAYWQRAWDDASRGIGAWRDPYMAAASIAPGYGGAVGAGLGLFGFLGL